MRGLTLVVVVVAQTASAHPPEDLVGREAIRRDARFAATLVASDAARVFLDAVARLPPAPPNLDDERYYRARYGTPAAYARAVDLLGARGWRPVPGARLLDFGYGAIGQLRAFALTGLDAVGVDVDPELSHLYAGADAPLGPGHVTLVEGHWPGDARTAARVGGGFTVIISKNTLKRGYIHPERPADEKKLIHLGVDDATFLRAVHDALSPGGWFIVYNICPAPSRPDQPFVPWSDGRSPFSRAQLEAAGLHVVAFDVDDTTVLRSFARGFGWDRGEDRMDLEKNLSVLYTLAQRPASPR